MRNKLLAIAMTMIAQPGWSSEMKYTPINPSFGGNPFNASALAASASAQRQFNAPVRPRNTSEDFARTITNSLLSRVSSKIAEAIYGEDAKDQGRFVVGQTVVDFKKVGDEVKVDIIDQVTGATTSVVVPVGSL